MNSALFLTFLILSSVVFAERLLIPGSVSPDGKYYAVMDIDRDPEITIEWKGNSYPQIEITEKATQKVSTSIAYFGGIADDQRPLREHTKISWRADSKAFGITVEDRHYSSTAVYALDEKGAFIHVPLPKDSYQKMTGFPTPHSNDLRARGRSKVEGWDDDGFLIYHIFLSPLPTFQGNDPLNHRVLLDVTSDKMRVIRVDQEKGHWNKGVWIKEEEK